MKLSNSNLRSDVPEKLAMDRLREFFSKHSKIPQLPSENKLESTVSNIDPFVSLKTGATVIESITTDSIISPSIARLQSFIKLIIQCPQIFVLPESNTHKYI